MANLRISPPRPPLGGVPVGTILPYAGPIDMLPDNWKLCDGDVVNDRDSPLFGQALPMLDDRFLMGTRTGQDVITYGGTNSIPEVADHQHVVKGNTKDCKAHSHGVDFVAQNSRGYEDAWKVENRRDGAPQATGLDHRHRISGSTEKDGDHNHEIDFSTNNTGGHNHGGDNRPQFCKVFFIIKIK